MPDLSDRLLSERMKELEAAGIVERHVTATSPIKVEYELTERGRELEPRARRAQALGRPLVGLNLDRRSTSRRERVG